jgi:hypothetical protein
LDALQGDKSAISTLRQRAIELNQAYGNGSMLNALVRQYAPEFAEVVHFRTSWDEIFARTGEQRPDKR